MFNAARYQNRDMIVELMGTRIFKVKVAFLMLLLSKMCDSAKSGKINSLFLSNEHFAIVKSSEMNFSRLWKMYITFDWKRK